jgi:hypothetical protein
MEFKFKFPAPRVPFASLHQFMVCGPGEQVRYFSNLYLAAHTVKVCSHPRDAHVLAPDGVRYEYAACEEIVSRPASLGLADQTAMRIYHPDLLQ